MPAVISEAKPQYTRGRDEGGNPGDGLTLSVVVGVDGTVGDVRVTKSLHPDLDEQAITAAKRWRFSPGTKDGKPVPVEVTLELTFTLRK